MLKQLRMLSFIMAAICLVSCANNRTKTVAYLPAGSKIALVTGFDHDITYRYVGRTAYLNHEFEYTTNKLTPNESMLLPVKVALERNGYQVEIVPIANKALRMKINLEMGELTAAQRNYLMSLVHGRLDRMIIFTKAMSSDLNHHVENVGYGYGYIQQETDLYKGTNAFSAISLHVVTMQAPSRMFSQIIWAVEQVDNNLFVAEPTQINTRSILKFNQWMSARFSGYVIDAMRNANMLR